MEKIIKKAEILIDADLRGIDTHGVMNLYKYYVKKVKEGINPNVDLREEIKKYVRKEIGPIATPDEIFFVDKIPKTRSGKIMRRVIRALVSGKDLGDLTTLEDPTAVEEVKKWLNTAG